MTLKVKRTGSDEYGKLIKILTCGEPGSGKTKTAATWPNPLYVNAEGGLMSVADQNVPAIDVTDTGMLLELKNILSQNSEFRERELGTPVDTVVIDTIDEVARIFMKERMEATGKDAMQIADWGWLGEQLRALVRNYRNLPVNVVINCHLKTQTDEETGKMFVKPAIQGAMGDEIAGYVDLAVVLTARPVTEVVEGKNVRRIVRTMQTFPDSRQPWIKDRSGKLPMEFPINFNDDYKRLEQLIFGGRPQPMVQETVIQPVQQTPTETVAPATTQEPKKKTRAKKAEPAPAPAPAVEPEAVVPEPEPLVAPEPELEPPAPAEIIPDAPEPEPESSEASPSPITDTVNGIIDTAKEILAETSVPEVETPPAVDTTMVCADCGGAIATKDQADLSFIRFRRRMCKDCFRTARSRK